MSNFEYPDANCTECICNDCNENICRNGNCSGCATCDGKAKVICAVI